MNHTADSTPINNTHRNGGSLRRADTQTSMPKETTLRIQVPALVLALGFALAAPAFADTQIHLADDAQAVRGEILTVLKPVGEKAKDDIEMVVKAAMRSLTNVSGERVPYTNCFVFRTKSTTSTRTLSATSLLSFTDCSTTKLKFAEEGALNDFLDVIEAQLKDYGIDVLAAEPNYLCQAPTGAPSNIRILGDEAISAIPTQAGLLPLDLPAVATQSTGVGMLVAVLDTGVQTSHPMLTGKLDADGVDLIDGDMDPSDERNGIDDDGDGVIDNDYGHGTFVASMVLTVAPDAEILPIRLLDDEGNGNVLSLAGGIIYAVAHGADIINVSATIEGPSQVLDMALMIAEAMNVIVVASAGNEGPDFVGFPASSERVVAVTACDEVDLVPQWAGIGVDVNFVAPGVDMLGAFPTDLNEFGTARWSGTSFSAPLVAGSLATVWALNPWDMASHVVEQLEVSALDIDVLNPGMGGELGDGRVQPADAVDPE